MKKKALKQIVSLLLGVLLLLGCALPAGALTLDLEKTYTDVKRTDWFYNDVYWATITDTMSGTGAAFEPNAPMTRAMLVTTLYNRASPTELPGVPHGAGLQEQPLPGRRGGCMVHRSH